MWLFGKCSAGWERPPPNIVSGLLRQEKAASETFGKALPLRQRFEQGFRVGAIGLVAAHVSMDVVRRQQPDDVAELFELARPMVRRAARFEQYSGWRLLCKVRKESIARQASLGIHPTSSVRDRYLKD